MCCEWLKYNKLTKVKDRKRRRRKVKYCTVILFIDLFMKLCSDAHSDHIYKA